MKRSSNRTGHRPRLHHRKVESMWHPNRESLACQASIGCPLVSKTSLRCFSHAYEGKSQFLLFASPSLATARRQKASMASSPMNRPRLPCNDTRMECSPWAVWLGVCADKCMIYFALLHAKPLLISIMSK